MNKGKNKEKSRRYTVIIEEEKLPLKGFCSHKKKKITKIVSGQVSV